MLNIINKLRKPLLAVAAAVVLLTPALASASNEAYFWQDANHQAIVGTGGVYSGSDVTFRGPAPTFKAPAAISCSDGSAKADLTLITTATSTQDATTPADASLSASCDVAADTGNISVYANKAAAQSAATSNLGGDPSSASCKGGVLGWFLCPVYDFILNSIKIIENDVIVPFLRISPVSTQSNSPPYQIWQQFRNLADIGFILAFLIVIFSHTLGINIDSYSLKKTLPRLVMAAILVQFSFVLVALGVDIANILGAGVQSLVLAPLKGHTTLTINNLNGSIGLTVGIAAAFAAVGSVLSAGILLVLFGAFFAVMAVFLTLVARQILVMLLLIISPLAFVAWVLPNTENLFKLWRTSLIRMLLMYPMIVLLFAAGKLFSAAAISTSGGVGAGSANAFLPLIAVVASVIPLYFIPLTFKYSGAALSTMNGWINNLTASTKKAAQSSQRYEQIKTRTQQRRTELAAGEKINMGFGVKVGGSMMSKQLGRGIVSPPNHGSNIRAAMAYNKQADVWKKRLDEEGMTYEGISYLHQGEAWYQAERTKIMGKISAAQAAGNVNETLVQQENLAGLEEGKRFGKIYYSNNAARAGAALRRADMDVLSKEDREAIIDYTGYNTGTPIGKLLGDQLWSRAREGARKTNVHLAFTSPQGTLDTKGLREFVSKKNSGAWVDYTKDALEAMRDNGDVLEELARDKVTRQILINTLSHVGGPSTGAEQQQIITEMLKKTGPIAGVKDDNFWI